MYQPAVTSDSRAYTGSIATSNDLYDYFLHLEDRGPIHPHEFEENWRDLENHDFSAKEISLILLSTAYAIAKIRDHDLAKTFKEIILQNWDAWEEQALYCINSFNPQDLSTTINAHSLLKIKPSSVFLKQWNSRLNASTGQLKARDYVDVFHSAASLGIKLPQKVRGTLLTRIDRGGNFLRNAKKTPLLWSCAALDSMFPNDDYSKIAEQIKPQLPKKVYDNVAAKQRHDAYLWFGWTPSNQNIKRRQATVANGEKHFQLFLERSLGLSTNAQSSPIPQLPQAIDLTAHYSGVSVQIEIDGPYHFLDVPGCPERTYDEYDGHTRFRSALINRLAPDEKILRISSPISEAMTATPSAPQYGEETRIKLARSFLGQTARSKPGVYRAYIERKPEGPCAIGIRSILPQRNELPACTKG